MESRAEDPERSLFEELDPDRVAAEHPAWRLFRAHPSLGLEEVDGVWILASAEHEYGVRWLSLSPEERRARERDFLRLLLRRAQESGRARFAGGWTSDEGRTRAFAARSGASLTPEDLVRGRLTDTAIEAILHELPGGLIVDGRPSLVITTLDGWEGLAVWVDRWRAPDVERQLVNACSDGARRRQQLLAERIPVHLARERAADRELRAHVLVGGHRLVALATPLAGVLAVRQVWDAGVLAVIAVIVGVIAAADLLRRLVEWWYARGDRERR